MRKAQVKILTPNERQIAIEISETTAVQLQVLLYKIANLPQTLLDVSDALDEVGIKHSSTHTLTGSPRYE